MSDVFGTKKPVWDYYRIRKVVITFDPRYNQADTPANAPAKTLMGSIPYGSTVIDLDSGDIPKTSSGDPFLNQSTRRKWNGLVKHTRILTPKCNNLIGDTTILGHGFNSGPNTMWIDCSKTEVVHHGVKIFMENPGYGISWVVTKKYYVQFKGLIGTPGFAANNHSVSSIQEIKAKMSAYDSPPVFH